MSVSRPPSRSRYFAVRRSSTTRSAVADRLAQVRPGSNSRPDSAGSSATAAAPQRSRATDAGRIPVVLVTGFLGSGKTTLVNHLLKTPRFARAAVVVNEFGEVSIDHLAIDAPRRRVRVIDGGCLCGHVHEEVATSLLDLLEQRASGGEARFDRVIIETSGLADPVPIIQILLTDPEISDAFELRSVITVADGMFGAGHLEAHVESVKQAAVADVLVTSKTDIASPADLEALESRLAGINPRALRLRAANGVVPVESLDGDGYAVSGRSSEAQAWLRRPDYAAVTRPASADPAIRTFALVHEQEITVPGFVLWMNLLAGFRGAGLLRVKGIVNVEGRPYAIHAVQTVISEPIALDRWPDEADRISRLVFITRGMDADAVQRTFHALGFEGGRERRNMIIRPETYARFKETIELFRHDANRQRAPAHVAPGNPLNTSAAATMQPPPTGDD